MSHSRRIYWACFGVTAGLLIASFILPPTGVIDPTVLKGTSLIFGFACLGVLPAAVKEGINARVRKGDMTVEVSKGQLEPIQEEATADDEDIFDGNEE